MEFCKKTIKKLEPNQSIEDFDIDLRVDLTVVLSNGTTLGALNWSHYSGAVEMSSYHG